MTRIPSLAIPDFQERKTKGIFALFCVGSYLLFVSYGTTFLLAMSLSANGASEADAGSIMSAAMLSTFFAVINGLAANEAPAVYTAQSLVLFSLAYFVGVFGFPWLAGVIIVSQGMGVLLSVILLIALFNWAIALGRLLWRRWPRSQARRYVRYLPE